MGRKLDFTKSGSNKVVSQVMQKVDDDLDNKKRDIDIDLIDMNPDNQEIFGLEDIDYLADNIEEDGFQGAIEVYAKNDGRYEICSGHRRYLAAQKIGLKKIPAIVTEDVDDKTKSKRLVKSNILNRKMSPLKWGKTLKYYEEHVLYDYPHKKRPELARIFNMSEASVARYTALLKLIPELQIFADKKETSYNNLLPLTQLTPDEQRMVYYALIKIAGVGEDPFQSVSKIIIDQTIAKIIQQEQKPQHKDMTLDDIKKRISNNKEEISDKTTDSHMNLPEEPHIIPDIQEPISEHVMQFADNIPEYERQMDVCVIKVKTFFENEQINKKDKQKYKKILEEIIK